MSWWVTESTWTSPIFGPWPGPISEGCLCSPNSSVEGWKIEESIDAAHRNLQWAYLTKATLIMIRGADSIASLNKIKGICGGVMKFETIAFVYGWVTLYTRDLWLKISIACKRRLCPIVDFGQARSYKLHSRKISYDAGSSVEWEPVASAPPSCPH